MGAYQVLADFCEREGLTLEMPVGSQHDAAEPDRPARDIILEVFDAAGRCVGLSCARPDLGDTVDAAATRLMGQIS